jgi:transcriptional regulator with XRE-family HTH domain
MPRSRAQTLRSIAGNVQKWRVRRALTQAELAERADVELRFIQRVEQAQVNFGVFALVKLADALVVNAAELLLPADLPRAKRGRPKAVKPALAKTGTYAAPKPPKPLAVAERQKPRPIRRRKP